MSFFGVTGSMNLCSSHIYSNPKTIAAIKRQQEKERAFSRQEMIKREMQRIRAEVAEKKSIEEAEALQRAAMVNTPRQRTLADIEMLSSMYGVTLDDFMSKSQKGQRPRARQAACWMLWFCGYNKREIARVLGSDYSNVKYAIGQHMTRMGLDNSFTAFSDKRKAVNRDRTKQHYREMKAQEHAFSERLAA